MCGIAGFIAPHPEECVIRMTGALAHRGPDGSGRVPLRGQGGPVGWFGHRRLAILDLSESGRQPMVTADGRFTISYNGEVYNFLEIRRELEQQGERFQSRSDTEVVLKGFARWGIRSLEKYRGMFAFAIWDSEQERLFLARDRLGIKPLYYYEADNGLLFASEVRGLLAHGSAPRRLNPAALVNYLRFGSACDPLTVIEGVRALRPAHYLVWERGRLKEACYWDLPATLEMTPEQGPRGGPRGAEEVLSDELRTLLVDAVRSELVSDVPVGVFLSGGIDSSSVVELLHEAVGPGVNTFSVILEEPEYSETRYSRAVVQQFQTHHRELVLSARTVASWISEAVLSMDQPSVDGINTYIISREVRRAGIKVALSGLGGDEIFAGYSTFRTVPVFERILGGWRRLPGALAQPLGRAAEILLPANDRGLRLRALLSPKGTATHPYVLSRALFVEPLIRSLMPSATEEDHARSLACLEPVVAESAFLDPITRVSWLELRNYLANTLLRDTDGMSMAHGLEVRVPLIDHRLVECLMALPGRLKVRGSTPKHLLIQAAGRDLPEEVWRRPKRGFTLPWESWLRGVLRPEVESSLSATGGPLDGVLDRNARRAVWRDFLGGRTSWSRPWSLYVLDRWCRRNLTDACCDRS